MTTDERIKAIRYLVQQRAREAAGLMDKYAKARKPMPYEKNSAVYEALCGVLADIDNVTNQE